MQEGAKIESEILVEKELLSQGSFCWPDCSKFVRVEFKENEPSITFGCLSLINCSFSGKSDNKFICFPVVHSSLNWTSGEGKGIFSALHQQTTSDVLLMQGHYGMEALQL